MGQRGRPRHPDVLTPREWEVLALLCEGLSNPEIAERLGISRDGVKYHVSEILGKLGLESREAAAAWRREAHRPWWVAAAAPAGFLWRKAPAAIAAAAFGVALAGLSFLALLLACQANGSGTRTRHELAYLDSDGSLWLAEADSGERRLLAEDARCGDFPRLEWSPDGETLGCVASGEGRIVLRSGGGELIKDVRAPLLATEKDPGGITFHWAPSGEAFLYLNRSETRFFLTVASEHGDTLAELGEIDVGGPGASAASYGFPLWSPDGEQLVYRAGDVAETRIFTVDSTSEEVFSRDVYPLAWAMDGEALLAAANYEPAEDLAYPAYEAHLIYLENESSLELNRRVPVLDNGVQFWLSRDGTGAAYLTRDQRPDGLPGLGLLDLRTGESTPIEDSIITRGAESIPSEYVAFSPGGETLHWQSGDLDKTLYRFDVASGQLTELFQVAASSVAWSPDLELVAYSAVDRDNETTTLRVSAIDGSRAQNLAGPVSGFGSAALPFAWRPSVGP